MSYRKGRRSRGKRRRPKCSLISVWGYPADAKLIDPRIEFAWACRCGRSGNSYPTREKADLAASAHFEETT